MRRRDWRIFVICLAGAGTLLAMLPAPGSWVGAGILITFGLAVMVGSSAKPR